MKIMKINNVSDLKQSVFSTSTEGLLGEIEDLFRKENFNDENLKVFKKNITRVLTLISRDKNFLALLNEMNCFEVFLDLFKNDLILYINKEKDAKKALESKNSTEVRIGANLKTEVTYLDNILPEFLKLILNLLKNYDEDMNFIPNNNEQHYDTMSINDELESKRNYHTNLIISDVYFCLTNSIIHFDNKEIIEDILKYVISSESRQNQFYKFINENKDEDFLSECKFII